MFSALILHHTDENTLVTRFVFNFVYCDQYCTATIYSTMCSVRGTHTCLSIPKYTINQRILILKLYLNTVKSGTAATFTGL